MDSKDIESTHPSLGSPLLGSDAPKRTRTRRALAFALPAAAAVILLAVGAVVYYRPGLGPNPRRPGGGVDDTDADSYPWTNDMLRWQRTGYHFQPEKNFQSDPNAAFYYKGWYHFFYQYNPTGTAWDTTISWGHAVSRDLVRWLYLPMAMVPDHWYDEKGVWSGYATLLPDGRIVVLYTGGTTELVQVQNLAVPANLSDPLLLEWRKSNVNPILFPPPGIGIHDFRDPFPVWYNETDSTWHMLIGSKDDDHYGIVLVYTTKDFLNYTLLPGSLHSTKFPTGMLECVDLFPVGTSGPLSTKGLEVSQNLGSDIKWILKASMDDERHDYYALGSFDFDTFTFVSDDESLDVGVGLRYDWGKFYASKTFYDQAKQRRVLWGYVGEVDSKRDDMLKGWATIQNIPRTILFDVKTKSNLILWPVEEVESLRSNEKSFAGIPLAPGSVVPLEVGEATQLDIEAEFEVDEKALGDATEADVTYNCSTSGGSVNRGLIGPFGLLVLATHDRSEQTTTYFYVSRGIDGNLRTHFCQDELRSSKAAEITKRVVGYTVPVLHGETWSLRMLVDHSIVESFAQGGRSAATSRVYPTEAIYGAAKVFLFNNATGAAVTAKSVRVWQMNNTQNHVFPGLQAP